MRLRYRYFCVLLVCAIFSLASRHVFANEKDSLVAVHPSTDTLAMVGDSLALTPETPITQTAHEEFLPKPFDWLTNLPHDWWTWTKSIFQVERLPLLAGLTAATAVTIVTDYETWQPFKKQYEKDKTFRDANDFFAYLGDGKVQFGLAGAFALYGFSFGDDRAIRTASQTVEVILASGAVIQLLKHITGRESPIVTTTPTGRWRFFPNQIEYAHHVPHYDAFPSGHICTATATLTIIAENYPEQKWIRWVGYPVLAGLATGLVSTSIHWWSDIPLGVAIGYSFGMLVSHPEMPMTHKPGEIQTNIGMTIMQDGSPGLGFSMMW